VSRTRRLTVVLLLNLGLVTALVITGLAAHPLAALAAGTDYLADAAAIGVPLLAIWLAARPRGYPNATTRAVHRCGLETRPGSPFPVLFVPSFCRVDGHWDLRRNQRPLPGHSRAAPHSISDQRGALVIPDLFGGSGGGDVERVR
jgi:hypothetical protein